MEHVVTASTAHRHIWEFGQVQRQLRARPCSRSGSFRFQISKDQAQISLSHQPIGWRRNGGCSKQASNYSSLASTTVLHEGWATGISFASRSSSALQAPCGIAAWRFAEAGHWGRHRIGRRQVSEREVRDLPRAQLLLLAPHRPILLRSSFTPSYHTCQLRLVSGPHLSHTTHTLTQLHSTSCTTSSRSSFLYIHFRALHSPGASGSSPSVSSTRSAATGR